MTSTSKTTVTASSAVPYWCRLFLLYVEPLFALNGAILVYTNPSKYLSTMTRSITNTVDDSTQFIYTELAGAWLFFAFTEAVVLRWVDDLRTWRLLCAGMLLSDIAYCHSCAQAVGGWNLWLDISQWTVEDWVVTVTTYPFLLARCVIALGIGLKTPRASGNH